MNRWFPSCFLNCFRCLDGLSAGEKIDLGDMVCVEVLSFCATAGLCMGWPGGSGTVAGNKAGFGIGCLDLEGSS